MCLKMTACGFFTIKSAKHPGGYFRSAWNKLDFIIVLVGFVALIPSVANVSSIRILRTLRPLRAVNSMDRLRIIVDALLSSFSAFLSVAMLVVMLLSVFSIIGVQMWNGVLHQQCYVINTTIPHQSGHLCTMTDVILFPGHNCEEGYECRNEGEPNPHEGLMSFDNFFQALLTLYQNMSLTDWTKTVYKISDAWSPLGSIFFCSLVFIMSFCSMNLVLAVIFSSYQHAKSDSAINIAIEVSP